MITYKSRGAEESLLPAMDLGLSSSCYGHHWTVAAAISCAKRGGGHAPQVLVVIWCGETWVLHPRRCFCARGRLGGGQQGCARWLTTYLGVVSLPAVPFDLLVVVARRRRRVFFLVFSNARPLLWWFAGRVSIVGAVACRPPGAVVRGSDFLHGSCSCALSLSESLALRRNLPCLWAVTQRGCTERGMVAA